MSVSALPFFKPPGPFATRDHHSLVGSEPLRQRHLSTAADLRSNRLMGAESVPGLGEAARQMFTKFPHGTKLVLTQWNDEIRSFTGFTGIDALIGNDDRTARR